jgi:hypothetical protein
LHTSSYNGSHSSTFHYLCFDPGGLSGLPISRPLNLTPAQNRTLIEMLHIWELPKALSNLEMTAWLGIALPAS